MPGPLAVLRLLDVLGLLNVLGALNVLGLLLSVLGLLSVLELFGVNNEPRWRIGPLRLFGRFNPLVLPRPLPRPERPRDDVVVLVDPVAGVGLMNNGVAVGFRERPDDAVPVERDEADEPAGAVGEQLTPGVIAGDTLVALPCRVEPVDAVPVVPVVAVLPVLPWDCANAGASALNASAHTKPMP